MDSNQIADGLIQYLMLVGLLTFHEFGHAWTAMKCGDDTARLMGRVSLNPIVHIDIIGTVMMPLLMIMMPNYGSFLIGWAKPVPVNPRNLNRPNRDDILVTLAGPGMNLLLAVGLVALARVGLATSTGGLIEYGVKAAAMSLGLCFFNMIPIPPLDGSQIMRVLTGMRHETFSVLSRFGPVVIIFLINLTALGHVLNRVTLTSLDALMRLFGIN